jgi:hypothetical protein
VRVCSFGTCRLHMAHMIVTTGGASGGSGSRFTECISEPDARAASVLEDTTEVTEAESGLSLRSHRFRVLGGESVRSEHPVQNCGRLSQRLTVARCRCVRFRAGTVRHGTW